MSNIHPSQVKRYERLVETARSNLKKAMDIQRTFLKHVDATSNAPENTKLSAFSGAVSYKKRQDKLRAQVRARYARSIKKILDEKYELAKVLAIKDFTDDSLRAETLGILDRMFTGDITLVGTKSNKTPIGHATGYLFRDSVPPLVSSITQTGYMFRDSVLPLVFSITQTEYESGDTKLSCEARLYTNKLTLFTEAELVTIYDYYLPDILDLNEKRKEKEKLTQLSNSIESTARRLNTQYREAGVPLVGDNNDQ